MLIKCKVIKLLLKVHKLLGFRLKSHAWPCYVYFIMLTCYFHCIILNLVYLLCAILCPFYNLKPDISSCVPYYVHFIIRYLIYLLCIMLCSFINLRLNLSLVLPCCVVL